MKISSDVLKEKLKYINFGVSKNNTDSYKYRAIRFETINGVVYCYSNDTINHVKVEIGPTDKDFAATIDFAVFSNFIKSCDGDITLDTTAKGLSVKTNVVKAKLPAYENKSGTNGIPAPIIKDCNTELSEEFRLDLIKLILDANHPVEAYQKVYFGDTMMVSDTDNVLVYEKKYFDSNIMLNLTSVELLSNLTNAKYSIETDNNISILYVEADELSARIIGGSNADGEYQYEDLDELFTVCTGDNVEIDTKVLSKAMSTSQLFKVVPELVFSKKGVHLNIDSVDFSYIISDTPCEDKKIVLDPKVSKKICTIGDTVTIYYNCDEESLIKVEHDDVREILSWR